MNLNKNICRITNHDWHQDMFNLSFVCKRCLIEIRFCDTYTYFYPLSQSAFLGDWQSALDNMVRQREYESK